ncbi:hypothetical protein KP509_03G022500 [Ceratopteris richardii]|nr:hypothetical protein KP509_03G022500 [Ceratopteris richardii]
MPVGMSKTQLGGIKDLCKNCKSGKSESVCFISNDGRVAAANTGPPTVCHFHLCNSTRCTASPNYKPPTSLPSQKVLQAKARALRSLNDEKVRAQIYATDEMGSSAVKSFFGKGKAVPPDENSDYRKELGDTNVQEAISAIHEHSVEENACTKSGTTSYEVGRPEECPLDDCQNEKGVPAGCMPPLDHAIDDKCCLRFVDCRDMPSRENASKDIVTKDSTHLNSIEAPQSGKICMERMRRKYLDCLRAQEAETVRLRKHEMIERRQAGEWMLDNAIGEILQRLAPDGEAGVRVMVEAFESIMHQGG